MRASSNIFELVKSLSGSEIEYVLNASRTGSGDSNKYLVLFHELLAQSSYNERELKRKLGQERKENNFAFTKNYLYHYILDRLEEIFHLKQVRLRKRINYGNLCISKEYAATIEPVLYETYEACYKLQLFDNCLAIVSVYRQSGIDLPIPVDQVKELLRAKKSLLHYKKLFSSVRLRHHQSSFIRNILKTAEFRNVYDEEQLEADSRYNFNHKVFLYLAKGIVYYAIKDNDNGMRICSELIKLWEKNPQMIEVRFSQYYNTYYNKALIYSDLGKYGQAIEVIQFLRDKLEEMNKGTLFQKYMLYNLMIDVYNSCGHFEKSLEVIDEYSSFRKGLVYGEDTIHSEQQYYFYLAKVYYGTGKLKEAIKCLNHIITNELEYNSDITCMSHVLYMIVLFESGKTDIIEYKISNTIRLLEKRGCMLGSVQLLTRFLMNYIGDQPGPVAYSRMLMKLRDGIEKNIRNDSIQQNLLSYFNILAWVKSKIEKCSLAEMLKEESRILSMPGTTPVSGT